jgi:hypothetical protein
LIEFFFRSPKDTLNVIPLVCLGHLVIVIIILCSLFVTDGSLDVVHGIAYSLILLNTDLHVVNTNMTKDEFVENTLQAVLYPPAPFIDPLLQPESPDESVPEPEEKGKTAEEIEKEKILGDVLKVFPLLYLAPTCTYLFLSRNFTRESRLQG